MPVLKLGLILEEQGFIKEIPAHLLKDE